MKHLLIIFLLVALPGCGGGGGNAGPVPGTVAIDCADLSNSDKSACQATVGGARVAVSATTMLDYGEIERGVLIYVSANVANDTTDVYHGFIEMVLDVDCHSGSGAPWVVLPIQPLTVAALDTRFLQFGAQCGGADLGPSTITFSVYDDAAGTIVRDRIVGSFTLIE